MDLEKQLTQDHSHTGKERQYIQSIIAQNTEIAHNAILLQHSIEFC